MRTSSRKTKPNSGTRKTGGAKSRVTTRAPKPGKAAREAPATSRKPARKPRAEAPPAPKAPAVRKPEAPAPARRKARAPAPSSRAAARSQKIQTLGQAGPERRTKLGTKHLCFKCKTKFYDMNRPEPVCPRCGADQRERPQSPPAEAAAPPPPVERRPVPRPMAPLLDEDEDAVRYDEDVDLGIPAADDDEDEEFFEDTDVPIEDEEESDE